MWLYPAQRDDRRTHHQSAARSREVPPPNQELRLGNGCVHTDTVSNSTVGMVNEAFQRRHLGFSAVLPALIRCRRHSISQPRVSGFLGRKAGRDLGYAAREADLNGKAGQLASYHSKGCHCLYMAASFVPHTTLVCGRG